MSTIQESRKPSPLTLALVGAYVTVVLLVDTLAALGARTPIDWRAFRWHTSNSFDLFKFLLWFVVPFVLSCWRMDWGYLGFARWKRRDWAVLAGLAILGALAVLSILVIPGLRAYYPSQSGQSAAEKWADVGRGLLWVTSWLLGWEFLHRYFLLRPFSTRWPRYGWLIVPFSEGAYHLQKHWTEMAAMVAFSLVLTTWAVRRKNALLPFLAHLIVEVELIIFMVVV